MKAALFEAKCGSCGHLHARPELGDFAYGQFIFTGELGTVHAYAEAPSQVWSILESALPPLKNQRAAGDLLQYAYAHFADPIDDQNLVNHFVCPKCHSSNAEYWAGTKKGETEIGRASYKSFMSLPLAEQQSRAKALYSRIEAQQGAPVRRPSPLRGSGRA